MAEREMFMIETLQKIYIAILNPIFQITKWIPAKIKDRIIYCCFFAMMILYLLWRSYPVFEADVNPDFRWKAIIISVLCFIVIVMSIKEQLKPVEWNRWPCYFFFGYILVMIGTSFLHPIGDGFLEMLTISFFGFPCLYFVWHNREDYESLYKLVSMAFSHVFLIYFLILVVFYPISIINEYDSYVGTLANPNMLGQFCVVASTCTLYIIFLKKKNCQLYLFLLGLIGFYLAECESRTAILIFMAQLIFFFVSVVTHVAGKRMKKKEGTRLLLCIGVVVVLFSVMIPYTVSQIEEAYAAEEMINPQTETVEQYPNIEKHPVFVKVNQISSSRLVIWKRYVESLNLLGHDGREHLYISYVGKAHWAHNTILEYAYRSGVFAGLLYLALELCSVIFVGKGLFNEDKYKKWYVFSLMTLILYGISANIEVTIFFFDSPPNLLFFIGIMPLFKKREDGSNTLVKK